MTVLAFDQQTQGLVPLAHDPSQFFLCRFLSVLRGGEAVQRGRLGCQHDGGVPRYCERGLEPRSLRMTMMAVMSTSAMMARRR